MDRSLIRPHILIVISLAASTIPASYSYAPQSREVDDISSKLFVEDVETRRTAAEEIRESDREIQLATLPAMIKSLDNEKDSQVRLAVLEALQILGPQAEPAAASLLQSLKEKRVEAGREEQHQDYRIAMILSKIGAASEKGLIELLDVKREHVKAYAAMALGQIHTQDAAAIDRMIKMLSDKNDLVREESSVALANIGPIAAPNVAGVFPSATKEVQVGILKSLTKWDRLPESAQSIVKRSMDSSDPAILALAISSISRCDLPVDKLRELYLVNMSNGDPGVRFSVINSVGRESALVESMRSDLLPLLRSSDQGVVRDAATLLTTLGPGVMPDLLSALEADNSQVQILGESLALLGPSKTEDIIAATHHSNASVRAGAATALGYLIPARTESIDALGAALADANETVQSQALAALAQLGPRGRNALPAIRSLLQAATPDVRQKAADAMFQVAPRNESLVSDLTPLVSDSEDAVQIHIIQLLQTLGPISRPAIASVMNYLHDEPSEVRLAAATFMASHGPRAVDSIPSLRLMLTDPASDLRMAAITALMQMRAAAKPVFSDLVVCLADSDSNVRGAAINAITVVESDFSLIEPHLAAALKSDDPVLCGEGLKAFGRMGKDAGVLLPIVIPLAKNKDLKGRVDRSLRAFKRGGPDARTIPQLIELAKGPEPNVALIAIEFLGLTSADNAEIISVLQSLEASENTEIKDAAKASLARLEPKES